MSAWRRVAIEKIPRFRRLIEASESIGLLWVDLWLEFKQAHADPIDGELIGRIYDYAWWCVSAPDHDTASSGVHQFFEDLPRHPEVRAQMAKWLSAEAFTGMGEIFRYHLDSYKEYREFVHEFYQQRARLGDAAPADDWRLTDEEFQAQVTEAVTSLQAVKQKRGEFSFEYLARATIIDNKEVMQHLTPAWQHCSGNAHAIAAAITPILRSLVASGAVLFPADALTFAAAALLLSERRSRATVRRKPEL